MAQRVKDLALSLLWLRLMLWRRFSPWPGSFHMAQVQPKMKKGVKKLKEKRRRRASKGDRKQLVK